ncbi:aminodeoxychorismate synthase component I [Virgibacillus sp. YIM 98842]|uniref:aminodeoxychorismate synthase component I n=1 Tax=Virgibacillus sp. YIM 98842 TaxID=2663533 RepID=UPI0013DA25A7|nr:aminodeoxychorismate synthase component I [Virgibacillus sp. YIM 98842]
MYPKLQFDFADDQGNKKPLLFNNPGNIITAATTNEVIHALEKVQDAVNKGYYAAGYLSYEAAPAFDQAFQVHTNHRMPLLWFGIFDQPAPEENDIEKKFHATDWVPQTGMDEYCRNINVIKEAIEAGDSYQVNYTIRMQSNFSGDSKSYYNQLAKNQSANYSAYLHIDDFSILSVSPELFFHLKNGKLTAKPMKGTAARGMNPQEDKEKAAWLYHSEKNRAENVMIVDLLRNDLGMIADAGTVQVPKLFSIERYPTVYQMTSTVTAGIPEEIDLAAIFKALFPCGSITGAPKISTMNIIHELEKDPREVYCGAIGFITPDQEAIFNVPIRTVMIDHNTNIAQYGVGGGITWHSDKREEYEEILTKAKVLQGKHPDFYLLETIGCLDGEFVVLHEHMERLEQSASYFHFPADIGKIKKELLDYKQKLNGGNWKLRLLLSRNGEIKIEAQEISPMDTSVKIALAKTPVDKNDIFLYHKTTNREVYKEKLQEYKDIFDVLLWNEDEELTEFTMGNVVVELNGELFTPPVSCGLLDGTFRKYLLRKGIIKEKIIKVDLLPKCSNVWFINSVRKWIPVEFKYKNPNV